MAELYYRKGGERLWQPLPWLSGKVLEVKAVKQDDGLIFEFTMLTSKDKKAVYLLKQIAGTDSWSVSEQNSLEKLTQESNS